MKNTTKFLTIFCALTLFVGLYTFAGSNPKTEREQTREAINKAIQERRVDSAVKLISSYREVNEKQLQFFNTWHESDDMIYNAGQYVVYYNDTQIDADYVFIYEIN